MTTEIHPTAVVDPGAQLGRGVRVGPYCHIGPGVRLGDGCELIGNVTLLGPSTFGEQNVFYPGSVLGAAPQDLKYKGGPTSVQVGSFNQFREGVTVHRGTEVDTVSGGVTRIGNHNLLMVGAHVAHDAEICNHVIIANYVQLAGHVRIEDFVNIGGVTAISHFVTVGRYAFIGGVSRATHDVPPYVKVQGMHQRVRAVNTQGLRRWNLSNEDIRCIKCATRLIYRRGAAAGSTVEAIRQIEQDGLMMNAHVQYLVHFVKQKMAVGVHGRVREHLRTDTDADRAAFYAAARLGQTA